MPDRIQPELLHLAPSSTARTAVAEYASSFRAALAQHAGLSVFPMLHERVPEALENDDSAIPRIRQAVQEALDRCGRSADQIAWVEADSVSVREWWATYYLLRLRPEIPLVVVMHEPPLLPSRTPADAESKGMFERFIGRMTSGMAERAWQRIRASVLEKATILLAPSRQGTDTLVRHYPKFRDRIAWLPPISIGPIPAGIEPNERLQSQIVQLTVFGRVHPRQHLEQVPQALSLLARDKKLAALRYQCRIRGRLTREAADGDYQGRLHRLIHSLDLSRTIDFRPGAMPPKQVDQLLRETDILIVPYGREGCRGACLPLLKAETWAIAPIAAAVPPLPEMITHEQDGLLFPPGNPHALAETIKRLLLEPQLRMDLARAHRERALRERSPSQIASLVFALGREILLARKEERPPRFPDVMRGAPQTEETEETHADVS